MRKILHDGGSDSPFRDLVFLGRVSLDGTGTMLFVSGERPNTALNTGFAVFDISTDASNPAHLDTLTELHYEIDSVFYRPRTHLRFLPLLSAGQQCTHLVPHIGHSAVDVFCTQEFAVVLWNPETSALEVADFAMTGEVDRFGNRLPRLLGGRAGDRRQIAQSPDGNHVYRATNFKSREYSDAIHIFERASAMKPDENMQ